MIGKIIVVALVGAALVALVKSRGPMISGEEARTLVSEGAKLVDVRTPGEFASGHIQGALNIPVDQIGGHADELGAKDRPVVVYCRSGMRSAKAKQILEAAGFTKVSNLGGIGRWPTDE